MNKSFNRVPASATVLVIAILFTLILAAATASAQQSSAPQQPTADAGDKAAPAPKAFLPFTTYDFGNVAKGEVISYLFVIQNLGNAELKIERLSPDCGCEVVATDKVIPPGKSGKARIEINTGLLQGAIYKTAMLYTNDPEKPQATLSITANILSNKDGSPLSNSVIRQGKHIGPVFLSPHERWGATIVAGQRARFEFTMTADREPVKPLKVEGGEAHFTSSFETIEEGKKYKLIIETVPTLAPGSYEEKLEIATDSAILPSFPIYLVIHVRPRDK